MTIRKYLPYLHPLFIAIAPAIFLWDKNFGEVRFTEVLPTVIILLVFGLCIVAVLHILFRNVQKSALAASVLLFIVLFFSYINTIFFSTIIQLRWRWSFIILTLFFLLVLYLLKRTKKKLLPINQVLAVTTGIFVLLSMFQVGNQYREQYYSIPAEQVAISSNDSSDELRDIYYIILDGYSSPEVVREVLGYKEIDTFVSSLETEGFFVASQSRSNYGATRLSLPSSLNMKYLESPESVKKHYLMLDDNQVKNFLKPYGYTYIHFGSDSFTFNNSYADININVGIFTPYQMALWENTILSPLETILGGHGVIAENLGFLNRRQLQWERTHFKLDRLAEIADEQENPVFIFAHFLVPQGSNSLDAQGNFPTQEEVAKKTRSEVYIDQMTYINREIEKLVTRVKNDSDPDPIIIIQGDHGFNFGADPQFNGPTVLTQLVPESVAAGELIAPNTRYSFPILNAYYFPDKSTEALYDTISPVNSFRVVFNTYFQQNLELYDDIRYVPDPDDDTQFIPLDL